MKWNLPYRQTAYLSLIILTLVACSATQEATTAARTAPDPTATSTTEQYAYSELISRFDYDSTEPLDIQEKSVRQENGIEVHDISFASPRGSRVTAYLIVPAGKGPFAGIIFLHWALGNRDEFLDEALQMAQLGAVCILPDAPLSRPGHSELVPDEMYVQTVIELRRAADLLNTRPDVDASRLGYVGHSYGATMGGVLAGVEQRIRAYVLMAGHPRFSKAAFAAPLSDPRLDAIEYIGHASPSSLFFQFAERDEYISREAALQFYETASDPKTIQWYDASHELNDQARLDRVEWLTKQLGLEQTP
jgi:dienelactone hydrolase